MCPQTAENVLTSSSLPALSGSAGSAWLVDWAHPPEVPLGILAASSVACADLAVEGAPWDVLAAPSPAVVVEDFGAVVVVVIPISLLITSRIGDTAPLFLEPGLPSLPCPCLAFQSNPSGAARKIRAKLVK